MDLGFNSNVREESPHWPLSQLTLHRKSVEYIHAPCVARWKQWSESLAPLLGSSLT